MVITRTPYRLSFFGGGTDFPAWYMKHGGSVLSTTIDKYCYLSCRYLPPFFEHKYRLVYSKIESANKIEEISHPAAREILRWAGINHGLEIHHDGDLPARSGMGTSSSFTVGLMHALSALKGNIMSKRELAMESIRIEQDVLKESVGSQDQVNAAYGGINHITFHANGQISVHPLTLASDYLEELNSHFILFYTGLKRTSSTITSSYATEMETRKRQLRIMKDLVDESLTLLTQQREISGFGELMHEAWETKKSLSNSVSNSMVDNMYSEARKAGAIGGKLTGAGGGGFLLLCVPPSKQAKVKEVLKDLIHVPFKFEFAGSQVVFFDHDRKYHTEDRRRASQKVQAFRELDVALGENNWTPGKEPQTAPAQADPKAEIGKVKNK
jgi:D-glycero-alpha-D-manno-heptose-7-phosphate kinase